MMELARVFSAAVAALQGDAGPLALSGSQYIRSDGKLQPKHTPCTHTAEQHKCKLQPLLIACTQCQAA